MDKSLSADIRMIRDLCISGLTVYEISVFMRVDRRPVSVVLVAIQKAAEKRRDKYSSTHDLQKIREGCTAARQKRFWATLNSK
jgi:hypothetical protein